MAKTENEAQMIHMLIDGALLKRVDDFRFKARFATRTEAVRWLLDAALKAKLAPKEGD
jgi:metal-responsive CopG/Arc/MetJ family transcriptional regulator